MKLLSVNMLCALTLGSLSAQELTLDACRHALKNALRLNHRDSLASAYCHLGEYYAYRNSDSARYYFEKGLSHVRRSDVPLYCTLLINTAETYFATWTRRFVVSALPTVKWSVCRPLWNTK